MNRLFWLLLFPCVLLADQLVLKDNLKKTEEGDFIVTRQGKNYTLLRIHTLEEKSVVLEEITIPERKVKKGHDWRQWVGDEAPKSSAWVMYEVDLLDGSMLDFYSVTKKGWVQVKPEDSFFSTLLNLRFDKVADQERRKMSHPTSPLWQPRLVANGKLVRGAKFDAWTTRWPKDHSPLAGKKIEIYLPQNQGKYPAYFPYWIDVSSAAPGSRVRIIDSGRNLNSPQKIFPRLPPQFVSQEVKRSGDLILTLHSSQHYAAFDLLAFDLDDDTSGLIPLSPELQQIEKGSVLRVPHHELVNKLTKGHRYRLIAKPHGFDLLAVESELPFTMQ